MLEKESQTHDDVNTPESLEMSTSAKSDTSDKVALHDTEIVLVCTVCSQVLNSNEQLDSHMETIHGNSPPLMKCKNCVETFSSSKDLDIHQSINHPAPYIKCSCCKLRVQNKTQLELHVKDCHDSLSSLAQPSRSSSANVTAPSTSTSPKERPL